VKSRHTVRIGLGMAMLVAACTTSESGGGSACAASDVPSNHSATIIIEGDPWSGYAPFRDETLLQDTGYDLQYVEQICQDVRAADLTAGSADFEVTTLDQYVLNDPEGTVVGVIDQSRGADALALNTVTHPYLKSVDDIPQLVREFEGRGTKPVLAYTGNSPSEMLLNELANTTEELRLSDFELVSVDQSATAYQMLQDDSAQLAIIWAPDTSAAKAKGYTIALSSEDVPDSIVDVIVASDRLIEREPEAVRALLAAFYARMDELLANERALVDLIARDGNLDRAAAQSVLDGITLYGSRDADVFMNEPLFPLDLPQMEQSVKAIAAVLALNHDGVDPKNASIEGRYVAALQN
jgi:OmpA-OmpF porin, OOP family